MTEEPMTELIRAVERFIHGLAVRAFEEVEECLAPETQFRALVPPGLREATDASGAVEHLRRWFDGADHFELIESEVEPTADHVRFRYRIRLYNERGWRVVDQSGYAAGVSEIQALDLVCSGFRPVDPSEARTASEAVTSASR